MKGQALRIETVLALTIAWAFVFLVPFRWMCRVFGTIAGPLAGEPAPAPHVLARARAVVQRIDRVAGRLPWRSTCLIRAVAARLLFARRGMQGGTIRFGVRKASRMIEAHAWLILGGAILMGGEEAVGYVPLADLAPTYGRPVR